MNEPDVLFSEISRNKKTGRIPVSHTEWTTCPSVCLLNNGKGCYGKVGPIAWHWKRFYNNRLQWRTFCNRIHSLPTGAIWRHNVVGDLPGLDNLIDLEALKLLVRANINKRGYTYTHKPVLGKQFKANREAIMFANENGFTVSLSAVGLKHADKLCDLNIAPVVTVLPMNFPHNEFVTPKGKKGAICPAENDLINCKNCGICSFTKRDLIIGFRAHGAMKAKVSKLAG